MSHNLALVIKHALVYLKKCIIVDIAVNLFLLIDLNLKLMVEVLVACALWQSALSWHWRVFSTEEIVLSGFSVK